MCNKCHEIEDEIQNFRRLVSAGLDALSLAMIRCAIESLEADRASLRCEAAART